LLNGDQGLIAAGACRVQSDHFKKVQLMTNAVHRLTISQMAVAVQNMRAVMDKAESHASANGFDTVTLLQARLYPNMFNLQQQLQYVCYVAVDLAQHFSSAAAPRVGYDEETWEQLTASLETTAAYLSALSDADVARNEGKTVPSFMDDTIKMNVVDYAARVSLPDFYFHMAIAYAILRHNGVPLGKDDYLGKVS
jgi:hypothetical protein